MTNIPTEQDVSNALVPYQLPVPPNPIVVSNEIEYAQAADVLKDVIRRKKELDTLRRSITKPLDDAKKSVQAMFTPVLDQYTDAENFLRRGMIEYSSQKEKARREQEAKLRDEHAKELAQAETAAAEAAERGDYHQARAALVTVAPPIPTVVSAAPKVSGISTRSVWKGEVEDLMEFLLYVVENDAYHLISVNQSAIDAMARASKGTARLPGVVFKEEQTLVARS